MIFRKIIEFLSMKDFKRNIRDIYVTVDRFLEDWFMINLKLQLLNI